MAHLPIAPPPPPSDDPSLTQSESLNSSSALLTSSIAVSDTQPADPVVVDECAVCLLPITVSTLARLGACPHVFHKSCIDLWHKTRWKNGQTPNCPSCRKCGPLTPAWPLFDFYRSCVFGPSGTVTILPHLLLFRTRHWFSANTKLLVRFIDIRRFVVNRNYVYLFDHSDELIITFRPHQLARFLQILIQHIKKHNPHITPLLHSNPPTHERNSLLP